MTDDVTGKERESCQTAGEGFPLRRLMGEECGIKTKVTSAWPLAQCRPVSQHPPPSTALSDSLNMCKVIGGHTDWKCYSIAQCIVYFQCWKTILWLAADQGHVKQTLFHSLILSFCPNSFCSPRWNLLKYLLLLWAAEENANWLYYFALTEL